MGRIDPENPLHPFILLAVIYRLTTHIGGAGPWGEVA